MDLVQKIASYRSMHNIGEVPIVAYGGEIPLELKGSNGGTYRQIQPDVWMDPVIDDGVAYISTTRHAGGVVLRPLYVRIEDTWCNATTGREVDFATWENARARAVQAASGTGQDAEAPFAQDGGGSWQPDEQRGAALQANWQQRCQALVEICEAYTFSAKTVDSYQHMCDGIARVLESKNVFLNVFSPDGLELLGASFETDGTERRRWEGRLSAAEKARLAWMRELDAPVVLNLAADDMPGTLVDVQLGARARCAVVTPLQANGKVIGACLALFDEMRTLTAEDEQFLMLVGRMLGSFSKRTRDMRSAIETRLLEERKIIGREIHDNVSTLMGSLALNAAAASASLADGDIEAARRDLERLERVSVEAMGVIDNEILTIDIPLEEETGFVDGLDQCLRQFESNWGIETELDASEYDAKRPVHLMVSFQLARILNESLSNVLKHANADHVKVTLAETDWCLSMIVEDDGDGFDVDALDDNALGIEAMRKRAQAAGGEVSFFSDAHGTSVCVDIPYEKPW